MAGLHEVCSSADVFHAKYIPLENILNLRNAAKTLSIICEINYYKSNNYKLDQQIKQKMGFDKDNYFFAETLSYGGRDISGYLANSDFVFPSELEENNSMFMNFLPNGDVFVNVDTNKTNKKMKNTPLYLGNFFLSGLAKIFKKEQKNFYSNLYSLYGNQLHRLLCADNKLFLYYKTKYASKKYLTLSEYYTTVFTDKRIVSFLDKDPSIFLDTLSAILKQ